MASSFDVHRVARALLCFAVFYFAALASASHAEAQSGDKEFERLTGKWQSVERKCQVERQPQSCAAMNAIEEDLGQLGYCKTRKEDAHSTNDAAQTSWQKCPNAKSLDAKQQPLKSKNEWAGLTDRELCKRNAVTNSEWLHEVKQRGLSVAACNPFQLGKTPLEQVTSVLLGTWVTHGRRARWADNNAPGEHACRFDREEALLSKRAGHRAYGYTWYEFQQFTKFKDASYTGTGQIVSESEASRNEELLLELKLYVGARGDEFIRWERSLHGDDRIQEHYKVERVTANELELRRVQCKSNGVISATLCGGKDAEELILERCHL